MDEDDGQDGHRVLQQVGVEVDVPHPAVFLCAALLDQDGSVLLDAFLVLLPVKLLDQVVEGDHPLLHDLERSALHEKERKGKGHEAVVKVRQGLKECMKSRQSLKPTSEKFEGDGSRISLVWSHLSLIHGLGSLSDISPHWLPLYVPWTQWT